MKKYFYFIVGVIASHKVVSGVIAGILAAAIALSAICFSVLGRAKKAADSDVDAVSSTPSVVSEESQTEDVSSKEPVSSEEAPVPSEPEPVSSVAEPLPESKPAAPVSEPAPAQVITEPAPKTTNTNFSFNGNLTPESNAFFDAMIYSGYNIEKHRADGLMWIYILCKDKRAKGWLSNITYGGGCTGYETTPEGLPNIARFEKGGLVCASYATYVYFNYLPNVAGIDTSYLPRPAKSHLANDFYAAAKEWVRLGYSTTIPFTARLNGNMTVFNAEREIPIGSVMVFRDIKQPGSTHGSHVAIYAGYMNGQNWVYHVGNDNGPEFCTMERMSCGPDPQWPLEIITTPSGILETIQSGAPAQ